MTVIRPNSISGITSITAQSGTLEFYTAAGSTLNVTGDVTGNVTGNLTGNVNSSGVSTFSQLNVGVGGTIIKTTVDGRVGIATDIPYAKTHIQINAAAGAGSGNAAALWLKNANQTANNSATIFAGNDSSAACAAINFVHANYSNNQGFISFDTRENALTYNSNAMKIDAYGRVTMPYQPMFYAYQTGSVFTSSTGIFNSTQWNATLVNVGNHFNTSNGRFTAPIAGKYVFYGKGLVRWSSSAGNIETTLYKNGSNVVTRGLAYDYMVAANDHATQFFMVYLDLAAGDFIQYGVVALVGGTNLYYGENLGSFSGQLIG